jgi:hypothetical protein
MSLEKRAADLAMTLAFTVERQLQLRIGAESIPRTIKIYVSIAVLPDAVSSQVGLFDLGMMKRVTGREKSMPRPMVNKVY